MASTLLYQRFTPNLRLNQARGLLKLSVRKIDNRYTQNMCAYCSSPSVSPD